MKAIKDDPSLNEYLKTYRLKTEYPMNLDKDMNPVTDSENSIFTGVIDYIGRDKETLTFIDWKSGKTKAGSLEQVEYYALWGFKTFPNFDKIKIILWFIECNKKIETILYCNDMNIIETNIIEKINKN